MPRPNKGRTKRTDNDFYPTPQGLADAICNRLATLYEAPLYIVEPSAGSGNFVRAAHRAWPTVPIFSIDLRAECEADCLSAGAAYFTSGDWPSLLVTWGLSDPGLILGNPPFSCAEQHILSVLTGTPKGTVVAFLLKMNFFGGKDRTKTLWSHRQLKYLIPIVGRPSFKKTELASNDTNEYGIFIWETAFEGAPTILFPHIEWK